MFLFRTARADTELGTCPISAGDHLILGIGAANRDESVYPDAGQFRLEVDTTGIAQSHMLHVLQASDADAPPLAIEVDESGTDYDLLLRHPQRGQARLRLRKGMSSAGGAFGWSGSRAPVLVPLAEGVQTMTVTPDGPRWR